MTATFAKLQDGSWGIRVQGTATPGQTVTVKKKDGSSDTKTVGRVVWSGNGVCLCSIADAARPAPATATGATRATSRFFRDVRVGAVMLKGGRRHGVVTEVDADGGFCVVATDRAQAVEADDDNYHGGASRRRRTTKTELVCRCGSEADSPLRPTYSVQI